MQRRDGETADDRIARLEALVDAQQRAIDGLLVRGTDGPSPHAQRLPVARTTQGSDRAEGERPAVTPTSMDRRNLLRRALLAGGALVAGSAALAAEAAPAAANDGDTILAGAQANAESMTVIYADGASYANYPKGMFVVSDTPFASWWSVFDVPAAITAYANKALTTGVAGFGGANGVIGASDTGLGGNFVGATGVNAFGLKGPAVQASAQAGTWPVVLAQSYGVGTAVAAIAKSGLALSAQGPSEFLGRVHFSRSGVALVRGTRARPASTLTVTLPGAVLTTATKVLATIQQSVGKVAVSSAVPHAGAHTVTITLTAPVTSTVRVAWFVLD
jgi:hypothetical protein